VSEPVIAVLFDGTNTGDVIRFVGCDKYIISDGHDGELWIAIYGSRNLYVFPDCWVVRYPDGEFNAIGNDVFLGFYREVVQ